MIVDSKNNSPVVMVLIDAFSNRYLSKDNTPFLYTFTNFKYNIDPLFAFRGIESTIFTGTYPTTHGVWTEFRLKSKRVINYNKPDLSKKILKIVDSFSNDRIKKIFRYLLYKYLIKTPTIPTPNLIPIEALDFFELSQSKHIFEGNVLNSVPTLFDLFRKHKIKFAYIAPPLISGDKGILRRVTQLLGKYHYNFWYIKFSELDAIGHKYGPESPNVLTALKEVDRTIEHLFKLFKKVYVDFNFLILSDHGMSQVHGYVDLLNLLKKQNKLEMFRDYIVFLDSTMARFWFLNDYARSYIEEMLSNLNCGHILTDKEKKKLHIPLDTRYGEVIFVIDEGISIYPDFFYSSSPPKGMHGYAYPNDSPILLCYSESNKFTQKKIIEHVDIMPTVLKLLDVPIPETCEGSNTIE